MSDTKQRQPLSNYHKPVSLFSQPHWCKEFDKKKEKRWKKKNTTSWLTASLVLDQCHFFFANLEAALCCHVNRNDPHTTANTYCKQSQSARWNAERAIAHMATFAGTRGSLRVCSNAFAYCVDLNLEPCSFFTATSHNRQRVFLFSSLHSRKEIDSKFSTA